MKLESLITGIAHVGIRVRDLARSKSFYEGIGFRFIAGPVGPEPVAILIHPAKVVLNLILNANAEPGTNVLMDVPEKHPGYTHVALLVSDLTAVQEQLEATAVPITEGPIEFPGAKALFVRDPDGNVIEFHQTVS